MNNTDCGDVGAFIGIVAIVALISAFIGYEFGVEHTQKEAIAHGYGVYVDNNHAVEFKWK